MLNTISQEANIHWGSAEDNLMIKEILRLCLLKKKSRCFKERADVILKTIFRSLRKFFDYKFEGLMDGRKNCAGQGRNSGSLGSTGENRDYLSLIEDFVR